MNYIEIYNYNYNNVIAISKRLIVSVLKKAKKDSRSFNHIHNQITKWFFDYRKVQFIEKFEKYERESYLAFNNKYSLYSNDKIKVVRLVLENEVKVVFNGEYSPSYKIFIKALAINEAMIEVNRHFNNYYSYYKLIYELNKFEYFHLKDFSDSSYEDSNEYVKMLDLKYPNRAKEKISQKKKEHDKSQASVEFIKVKTNNLGQIDFDTIFNDNERMLIFHTLFSLIETNKTSGIKRTNLLKVIKIIGSSKDVSIFNNKPQNNTNYSKANKGIDYYSGAKQIELLDSTISKLKQFDIQFIVDALVLVKVKIISKSKKHD